MVLNQSCVFVVHCSQKFPAEGKLYLMNCLDSFSGNAQLRRSPEELAALSVLGSVPRMTSSANSAYTAIQRPELVHQE